MSVQGSKVYPEYKDIHFLKHVFSKFYTKKKDDTKKVHLQTKKNKNKTRQYASYIYSHLFSDVILKQCIAKKRRANLYQLCRTQNYYTMGSPKKEEKMATDNDIYS